MTRSSDATETDRRPLRRKADKLAVSALAVSLLVALMVGAVGFPALLDINQLSRENKARIAEEARLTNRLERVSLENCTTVRELTDGVYKLALALDGISEILDQQLGPGDDITIRLEEPENVRCKPGQIVPDRP